MLHSGRQMERFLPLQQGQNFKLKGTGLAETAIQCLRKATVADVPRIQKLINAFAERNEMLHRSMNELYEHLRDFHVYE